MIRSILSILLLGTFAQAQTYNYKGTKVNGSVSLTDRNRTPFGEDIVGLRTQTLQVKPIWGVSVFRDSATYTGTGASVDEDGGEIVVQSGTDGSGYATISTENRGQYRPGAQAEIGIAIRMPSAPTGNQDAKWGYFDTENGFGFGVDATGNYIFRRRGGTDTKVYQASWNIDTVDGDADGLNPSGKTLALSDGIIFNIAFVWYGYGDAEYYVNTDGSGKTEKILVHRSTFNAQTSIIDPNQPITVRSDNNGTASNLAVYIGGRQFSQVGPVFQTNDRAVTEVISKRTIAAAQNVWEPLIVLRSTPTFRGRPNSVRSIMRHLDVACDNDAEFKITMSTDVSVGGTPGWTPPTDWEEGETTVQTRVQGGSLTVGSRGLAIARSICVGGQAQTSGLSTETSRQIIPDDREIVVWGRRTTSNATVVSVDAEWEEFW